MSRLINALSYYNALHKVVQSPMELSGYVLENARQTGEKGTPGQLQEFSDRMMAEQLKVFNKATPDSVRALNKEIASRNIDSHLEKAGIDADSLSATQKRELQIVSHFNALSGVDFDSQLARARDHILSDQARNDADEGMNPSILFSMAFGNGAGIAANPPEDWQIGEALAANPRIAAVTDQVLEAHERYLASRGIKETFRDILEDALGDGRDMLRRGAIAAAFTIAAFGGIEAYEDTMANRMQANWPTATVEAQQTREASYSDRGMTLAMKAYEGDTRWDMAKEILDRLAMPSHDEAVIDLLEASRQWGEDHFDRLPEQSLITLKVPDNAPADRLMDLSGRGALQTHAGNQINVYALVAEQTTNNARDRLAIRQQIEERHDSDYEAPSTP